MPHNAPPQDSPQPDEFWQGVEEFNTGEFYACHDTLEALWIEAMEPDKTFYHGILQIAVGIYHLSNLNWNGAAILMGEGLYRLRDYESDYGGINMDQLLEESTALLKGVQIIGQERIKDLAIALELVPPEDNTPALPEGCAGLKLPNIIIL
ncbi:MAG: DUF309 domain-containing protein [Cyanobacteria bacterium P01_D01_bin.73]